MTTPNDDARETRSVEVELEVPGTPEEVWEAIATGPGISAWFVPTEVDGREGGTITQSHGADFDTSGVILAWDPPRRFAYGESDWQPIEGATPGRMADEFIVEARSGGTCVVRVVTSGFGTGADWDHAIESVRGGWVSALQLLRLYLLHFRGRRCSPIALGGTAPGSRAEVWAKLTSALGLSNADEGRRVSTSASDAPPLAGVVERAAEGDLLLRIEEPAPGAAGIYAGGPGEQTYAFVRLYLFGDDAPAIAAREEPAWRAWMDEHFASDRAPSEAGTTTG